jgi:arsenate reductase
MVDYPKLIERPIVVNGNKATIARPLEKINKIL